MRWTIDGQIWAITIADLRESNSTNHFGFSATAWPETGEMVTVALNRAGTRTKEMRDVDAVRSIPVMRETRCEALAALAEKLLAE